MISSQTDAEILDMIRKESSNNGLFSSDPEIHQVIYNCNLFTNPVNIIKKLVEDGANLEEIDGNGDTVLGVILQYIQFEYLEEVFWFLMEKGSNINVKNNMKQNLLFHVRSAKIAKYLLEHGVDVNEKNDEGNTPLHNLDILPYDVVQLLINNGANVNTENEVGETPIFKTQSYDIVKLLIDNGAKINVKNKYGDTFQKLMEEELERKHSMYYTKDKYGEMVERKHLSDDVKWIHEEEPKKLRELKKIVLLIKKNPENKSE